MKLRTLILVLSLMYSWPVAIAEESRANKASQVDSFVIRIGTLEFVGETVVFESGSIKEIFDISGKALLRASGVDFPGIPGLQEIGFRSEAGRTYEYGSQIKEAFVEKLLSDEPNVNAKAIIYRQSADQLVEIALTGRTQIIRVDMRSVVGGPKLTIWKNIEPAEIEMLNKNLRPTVHQKMQEITP